RLASGPISKSPHDFLHGPAVAVGIAEEYEAAPGEVLDLAHLHAAAGELRARLLNVGDHQLQASVRAGRLRRDALADGDRAGRARRRQLHEPNLVADDVVMVGVEASPVGVKSLGAVNIGDGHRDELELEIHASNIHWLQATFCPQCGQSWHRRRGRVTRSTRVCPPTRRSSIATFTTWCHLSTRCCHSCPSTGASTSASPRSKARLTTPTRHRCRQPRGRTRARRQAYLVRASTCCGRRCWTHGRSKSAS